MNERTNERGKKGEQKVNKPLDSIMNVNNSGVLLFSPKVSQLMTSTALFLFSFIIFLKSGS